MRKEDLPKFYEKVAAERQKVPEPPASLSFSPGDSPLARLKAGYKSRAQAKLILKVCCALVLFAGIWTAFTSKSTVCMYSENGKISCFTSETNIFSRFSK